MLQMNQTFLDLLMGESSFSVPSYMHYACTWQQHSLELYFQLCAFFLCLLSTPEYFSLIRIRKEKPRKMLAIWFSLVNYFINHLKYIYVDTYTDVAPPNTTTHRQDTTIQSLNQFLNIDKTGVWMSVLFLFWSYMRFFLVEKVCCCCCGRFSLEILQYAQC